MPWKISEQDGKFCVVAKSDGKVVKCHSTRKEANSHIAALYVNEPSAAKKSVGYGMLKSLIEERVVELKGCGANKPGGGGFSAGNTCARGGGSSGGGVEEQQKRQAKLAGDFADKASEKAKEEKSIDNHYAAMNAHDEASSLFDDIGDKEKVKHHSSASRWHEGQATVMTIRKAKRG